jgi:hypothetical protein
LRLIKGCTLLFEVYIYALGIVSGNGGYAFGTKIELYVKEVGHIISTCMGCDYIKVEDV